MVGSGDFRRPELPEHFFVHPAIIFEGEIAAADAALVGHDDQSKTGFG